MTLKGVGKGRVGRALIWIFFKLKCELQGTFDNHGKSFYLKLLYCLSAVFQRKKIIPAITSWNCLDFSAI